MDEVLDRRLPKSAGDAVSARDRGPNDQRSSYDLKPIRCRAHVEPFVSKTNSILYIWSIFEAFIIRFGSNPLPSSCEAVSKTAIDAWRKILHTHEGEWRAMRLFGFRRPLFRLASWKQRKRHERKTLLIILIMIYCAHTHKRHRSCLSQAC